MAHFQFQHLMDFWQLGKMHDKKNRKSNDTINIMGGYPLLLAIEGKFSKNNGPFVAKLKLKYNSTLEI